MQYNDRDDLWDLIPLVGDFVRAGKLGYKFGEILGDKIFGNSKTDRIIKTMLEQISETNLTEDISGSFERIEEVKALYGQIDYDNIKKYQLCSLLYVMTHCYNADAMFLWFAIMYKLQESNNPKESLELLREKANDVENNFKEALEINAKIYKIETTTFTLKKSLISTIQNSGREQCSAIKNYRQAFREYRQEKEEELKEEIKRSLLSTASTSADNSTSKWWIIPLIIIVIAIIAYFVFIA